MIARKSHGNACGKLPPRVLISICHPLSPFGQVHPDPIPGFGIKYGLKPWIQTFEQVAFLNPAQTYATPSKPAQHPSPLPSQNVVEQVRQQSAARCRFRMALSSKITVTVTQSPKSRDSNQIPTAADRIFMNNIASKHSPLLRHSYIVNRKLEVVFHAFPTLARFLQLLSLSFFPVFFACNLVAQSLPLPPRNPTAPSGDAFVQSISTMEPSARDTTIAKEFLSGNAPDFLREFCAITVTNVTGGVTNTATFFVTPDYLAIGSDTNYFLAPITPGTAQRIADQLRCLLPTRKMVDAIYAAATVKLPPSPIPPSAAMTTVPIFAQHNATVWLQRMALTNIFPLGTLVAGHQKDVVLSARLADSPGKLAIYGWHQTNGLPIQPLYLGHAWWWVDYSQCIRLISQTILVNGQKKSVAEVLADPKLCALISDEGVITNARYLTNYIWPENINLPWPEKFSGSNEWMRTIQLPDDVRILINAPPPARSPPARTKPVELIFYALPNGNTIEETIGKKPQPGDDWHYDIQHIGAQTRWLRQTLTNQIIVVAYLEAGTKSWPAWRKTHSDRRIAEILDGVRGIFWSGNYSLSPPKRGKGQGEGLVIKSRPSVLLATRESTRISRQMHNLNSSNQIDVVLAGHSGGGSLIFGYLNAVDKIPACVKRIAFLDSDYAYDSQLHAQKLADWLMASDENHLCVLAYQDYLALYNGKPFVSEAGGTWGRSHAMLTDLCAQFSFTSTTNAGLETWSAANGQIEFLLKENPDHKILHTTQVERNGFIQSILSGTRDEDKGYEYLGERAYTNSIQ